jgi:hypothetical protein
MKLSRVIVPWKPMDVWFIGDIQWSGDVETIALEHLNRTIAQALEAEKHGTTVRFIGMGDYIDFASPSNRARLRAADLYDNAVDIIEQKALSLTHEIYEKALKPTKGKWLGLVEGHHLYELRHGDTTDMRLCEMLDAPFAGTTGVVNLTFRLPNGQSKIPVTIWFAHGVGNGQTGYYPLSRLEKKAAEWEQVDVFAMGHTTKMAAEYQNKVYPRWGGRGEADLSHRKVILLGTGGYSKCYVVGAMQGRVPRGGYAERGMMNAAIIGSPVLHIRPRISEGRLSVDISAEA